jgi:hypothetical protein
MIKFILVQGDVRVDDKRKGHEQNHLVPVSGMTMPLVGTDCIIATGPGGRATLLINSEPVELKHDSFLRIQPDGRSFLQKHTERLGKQGRLFFGRLWAMAMKKFGTERTEITGSGGGGIRG